MLTAVRLRVVIPRQADAGDGLQIYSDFGTGTVNMSRPLLAAPAALLESTVQRSRGYGTGAHGKAVHGMERWPRARLSGHGRENYGKDPYAVMQRVMDVSVLMPPLYALVKFAGQIVDAAGNAQGGLLPEIELFLSAEEPPTLRRFEFSEYDAENDRVSFAIAENTE